MMSLPLTEWINGALSRSESARNSSAAPCQATLLAAANEADYAEVVHALAAHRRDERTRLAQDVERELREHFPEMVFETVIPRSVRVAEAPSYGLPVTEHAPSSPASSAYRALTDELVARG